MTTEEQSKYENAIKRVKKIKGFYSHLLVYVVINIMILIVNVQSLDKGESYLSLKNFSTALFWGIGLAAQGLSVFGPNIVLGQNWEEKKIKELMEKEKLNKYE
ncbi:2TM domain-containing protein [Flavobacterium micromati]|uniref:2TM domain-containing protein n=1 Tax=Flavobacterium micromati TaxID=229205 RepID=A0A1M5PQI0_9FLAO|nr:2TM domain-containing protein [Flavobacterium micromati]SHH03960.1 2TM domain-containing protein [Flavobacterium micromati]